MQCSQSDCEGWGESGIPLWHAADALHMSHSAGMLQVSHMAEYRLMRDDVYVYTREAVAVRYAFCLRRTCNWFIQSLNL
jgi:hypothetical protein